MCNNIQDTHDPQILNEDNNAIFIECKQCYATQRIGKDLKGNPEHRLYGEWFKRDVLQPDVPLYSKYAGSKSMNIV